MSQSDFVTRGQSLVSAGQFQEAVKVCRLGLLGRPTTVEGRVVLGQALLALKRYDEVLAEMRVALELDPASVAAQVLKGEALIKKGDHGAALDVLQRVRASGQADARAAQLLAEAERGAGRPALAMSIPAMDFLDGPAHETKHYPRREADDEDTSDAEGMEDTGGSFTRPTSVQTPGIKKRSQIVPVVPSLAPDATPSPAVLAVGDRSGTVEVDPELDGVELPGDDDFGDPIAPPRAGKASKGRAKRDPQARGQVISAAPAPRARAKLPEPSAKNRPRADKPREVEDKLDETNEVSSVELLDEDMVEVPSRSAAQMSRSRPPGPGTAVRNAVQMPSGPIDGYDVPPYEQPPPAMSMAPRPTNNQAAVGPPPHLAQLMGQPPMPMGSPPAPIASAMPTLAPQQLAPMPSLQAMQPMPMQPMPMMPPGTLPAAARPTLAVNAQPMPMQMQPGPGIVDQLFNGNDIPPAPSWARATMIAGGPPPPMGPGNFIAPDDPTRQPMPFDPRIAGFRADSSTSGSAPSIADSSQSQARALGTGARRGKSNVRIVLWVLVGAIMIGGGVVAGFWIRAMRLNGQIAEAYQQAVEVAKNDTWPGWVGARDRLMRIVEASNTPGNRAAYARVRALIAYELGDGFADASASVSELGDAGGLDAAVAAGYLALERGDVKAARAAADRAVEASSSDPAALYLTGQAALLNGDLKGALSNMKAAIEKEPRPLYRVGLARAYAAGSQWDEALAAIGEALKTTPDQPAALIERARVMLEAGRIAAGAGPSADLRSALDKLVADGTKAAEASRRASPAQTVQAGLALAEVDFVRGDPARARTEARDAIALGRSSGVSEQQTAEQICETLYAMNLLDVASKAVDDTLKAWPASRRARATRALLALAAGKPNDAVDLLAKTPDLDKYPRGLALRGQARLAAGDADGAKTDFDKALDKASKLEPALIGRAWIELAANDIDGARKRIEPRISAAGASAPLATVYAAILRTSPDPEDRKKAVALLERAVAGPRSVAVARAQLELGRLQRDLGDLRAARTAYEEASAAGSWDARIETGMLMIEASDPLGGRDVLDALLKDAGASAPPPLVLEVARARMIAGDNVGAAELLDQLQNQVEKQTGYERWRYDRERGRLALRRGDYAGAGERLGRALDTCGEDTETFLLAAEVAGADIKQAKLVDKLRGLVPKRLKKRPEAAIVTGKLALADGTFEVAEKAFKEARTALDAEHASPRRRAQAVYGYAVALYQKNEDQMAQPSLLLAIEDDPALYAAQLFLAELTKEREPKVAFGRTQKAVQLNPDDVEAWKLYGTLAARLRKRPELDSAITQVGKLAPGSEALRQLQQLRF